MEDSSHELLTSDFKSNLKEYLDIDKQIKEATKSLGIIKKRKNDLSSIINEHMRKCEVDEINIGEGKWNIKSYISIVTESLNKKVILDRCKLLCNNDEKQGQVMCDFICDPSVRKKTEKSGIKKMVGKKKK